MSTEEKKFITIRLDGTIIEAPAKYHPDFDLDARALNAYNSIREGGKLTSTQVFKLKDTLGDLGVKAVLRHYINAIEIKTHTPYGTGPSRRGWVNTGNYIVEVMAMDRSGNKRPSGIMVPELSDDSTFWNVLLDHDMKPVYETSCNVGKMRRYIKRRIKNGVENVDYGWWGDGGRALCVKVPIPEDDPAAMDAWDLIEAERNRPEPSRLEVFEKTKLAYQKWKEQQANV
jgi:hypothetical protein